MIIRVKFKTKPGDQFEIRKVVYVRLRELFEEHGIKFAHREVTVRVASDDGKTLSHSEKEAVAGAAISPILQAEPGRSGA